MCLCVCLIKLNTVLFPSNVHLEDPENLGSGSELDRNSLKKLLNLYAHRDKIT